MCGIAGILHRPGSCPEAQTIVRSMIAQQRHRGPDGESFYQDSGAALGHCRLAILDLSDAGRQPMSDPSGRFWIVFNGEIYNYLELQKELEKAGHSFKSHSDTEVLLASYLQWGRDCLSRLRGMFAFVIWDSQQQKAFAARDRLGIKPFHYGLDGKDRLFFASELKAILPLLPQRRVTADLARQYLAFNLIEHEPESTFIEGIRRLPPGHWFDWEPGQTLTPRRYWNSEVHVVPDAKDGDISQWTRSFREQLKQAVDLHLRSDVPVGTCLSGGLDSSALACAVHEELRVRGDLRRGGQHTFSACFEDAALDERPYMKAVVDAIGCVPHETFPNGAQLRQDMETWLWHQEEPVGGTGCYAQFCVARLARQHGIKVLLNGQGADEQLAGYRKFIVVYLRQLAQQGSWFRAAREALQFFGSAEILKTTRFAEGRRYILKSLSEVDLLFPGALQPTRPPGMGLQGSLHQRLNADLLQFSLPILLRYEDRNMMAFGIESRVPFVDHVFVEWMSTIPANLLLRHGWTKFIMREAMSDVLPPLVKQRKSKLGFSTPESDWLVGPLKEWVIDHLRHPQHLQGIVDEKGVQSLLHTFESGQVTKPLLNILFRLSTFENWARLFVSGNRAHQSTIARPVPSHP